MTFTYPGSRIQKQEQKRVLKKIAHDARAVVRSGMGKNHDPG
jgi:hypothetical protein